MYILNCRPLHESYTCTIRSLYQTFLDDRLSKRQRSTMLFNVQNDDQKGSRAAIQIEYPHQLMVRARLRSLIYCRGMHLGSLSLVLGHVLSPVRSLPRHSLLLIANYTSEPVCWLRPPAIFGKLFLMFSGFLGT